MKFTNVFHHFLISSNIGYCNMTTVMWYVICSMIWYDTIWYDTLHYTVQYGTAVYHIWYDMIWYMVWYDMVWYGMVWYGMIWYDMIWYDMIWYHMIWYDMIIKLCCYVIRSTRSPEIWWTVPRDYTVLFLSRDVKNTKFNQYLPVDLTSFNESNSRFRKPLMIWRWRLHGVALWRHGRVAWHNCLLLATASNVNCCADVANHVTWLWQAGDTENFERQITGLLWGRIAA